MRVLRTVPTGQVLRRPHLDRFAALGRFIDEHPRKARRMGLAQPLTDTWGRSSDATSRLKGLRAKLSNRYGTEFPPIETP